MASEKKYTLKLTQDEAEALFALFATVKAYPRAPFEATLCALGDTVIDHDELSYGVFLDGERIGNQQLEVHRVESR